MVVFNHTKPFVNICGVEDDCGYIPRYVDILIGTAQIILCLFSVTLNTIVILQHCRKTIKIASFLFCLLALSDEIKSLLSIYPSYNFIHPDGYESEAGTPSYGQIVYSQLVFFFLKNGLFITALLNVHRFVSVRWPMYQFKRRIILGIYVVWSAFHIGIAVFKEINAEQLNGESEARNKTGPSLPTWDPGYQLVWAISTDLIWQYTYVAILTICYCIIVLTTTCTLYLLHKQLKVKDSPALRHGMKTIILLTLSTTLLFTPWTLVYTLDKGETFGDKQSFVYRYLVLHALSLINAVLNPCILIFMSKERVVDTVKNVFTPATTRSSGL